MIDRGLIFSSTLFIVKEGKYIQGLQFCEFSNFPVDFLFHCYDQKNFIWLQSYWIIKLVLKPNMWFILQWFMHTGEKCTFSYCWMGGYSRCVWGPASFWYCPGPPFPYLLSCSTYYWKLSCQPVIIKLFLSSVLSILALCNMEIRCLMYIWNFEYFPNDLTFWGICRIFVFCNNFWLKLLSD